MPCYMVKTSLLIKMPIFGILKKSSPISDPSIRKFREDICCYYYRSQKSVSITTCKSLYEKINSSILLLLQLSIYTKEGHFLVLRKYASFILISLRQSYILTHTHYKPTHTHKHTHTFIHICPFMSNGVPFKRNIFFM